MKPIERWSEVIGAVAIGLFLIVGFALWLRYAVMVYRDYTQSEERSVETRANAANR